MRSAVLRSAVVRNAERSFTELRNAERSITECSSAYTANFVQSGTDMLVRTFCLIYV